MTIDRSRSATTGAGRGARRGSVSTVDVPAAMAGPQLEAVIDLGFHPDAAGFQSEGLVWIDGQPVQGIHPRRTGLPLPTSRPGPFTFFVEAASNPAFPGYRPSPLGSLVNGRRASRCTACARPRSALATTTVFGSAARRRRAAGAGPCASRRRGSANTRAASVGGRVQRARPRRRRRDPLRRRVELLQPRTRRCEPGPVPTKSSPSVTRTSTRRGCGRSARRSASVRARSRRRSG